MNFLVAPLVVGISGYFIYMTFELFARRQERNKLIDKLGQNLASMDTSILQLEFGSLLPSFKKKSFASLRIGCLFTGLGFGLLLGLFICLFMRSEFALEHNRWERDTFYSVAYGASVLLFGGIGLLISYIIESRSVKKEEKQ